MTITLYGIPNCDTVKKARQWLDKAPIAYTFHNFKKQGVPTAQLQHWLTQFDRKVVINYASKTWRSLREDIKAQVRDTTTIENIVPIVQQYPSMIKRPVLQTPKGITFGFDQTH